MDTQRYCVVTCTFVLLVVGGQLAFLVQGQGNDTNMTNMTDGNISVSTTITPMVSTIITLTETPVTTPIAPPMFTTPLCDGTIEDVDTQQFNLSSLSYILFEVVIHNNNSWIQNQTQLDAFVSRLLSNLNSYCQLNTTNCSTSMRMYGNSTEMHELIPIYTCEKSTDLLLGLVYVYNSSAVTAETVIRVLDNLTIPGSDFSVQKPSQNITIGVMPSPTTSGTLEPTSVVIITNLSTPTPPIEISSALTVGQIAGIAVGAVAVVLIVAGVIIIGVVVGVCVKGSKSSKVASIPVKSAPKRAAGDGQLLISHGNKNSNALAITDM